MPSLRCTFGLLSLLDVLHLRAFVLWAYRYCMTRTQWMSNSQHRPARAVLLCLVALCAFAFYSTSHRSRCDLGLLVCSAGLLFLCCSVCFLPHCTRPHSVHTPSPACLRWVAVSSFVLLRLLSAWLVLSHSGGATWACCIYFVG